LAVGGAEAMRRSKEGQGKVGEGAWGVVHGSADMRE
jgi:hypothetical protein